jgi:hypothetical protein
MIPPQSCTHNDDPVNLPDSAHPGSLIFADYLRFLFFSAVTVSSVLSCNRAKPTVSRYFRILLDIKARGLSCALKTMRIAVQMRFGFLPRM